MKAIGELTAWEEINPATALARQPERASMCSELQPASREEFRNELVACLSLVAPVGMTEELRRDWLKVAWATVGHLPADLLARGCKYARETADHPAKIVPAILSKTDEEMKWRRNHPSASDVKMIGTVVKKHVLDRRGEAMSEDDTNQLNGILENLGATARYRADGSRYSIT